MERLIGIAPTWGILGPEELASGRRVRTLGLGATVRQFNDLAVPGMGGVWFGKQLMLATLGVILADKARPASNKRLTTIETANAVEALACWLQFNAGGWSQSDPRLRGRRKMQSLESPTFQHLRRRSTYVTQPMRMTTVQPLRQLRLVDATHDRFSAFRPSDSGQRFVELSLDPYRPYNTDVLRHLLAWVTASHERVTSLRQAMSPTEPLPPAARELLRETIVGGSGRDPARRRAMLQWVEGADGGVQARQATWSARPAVIDGEHWKDLHAGALFFRARASAIELLDQVEKLMLEGSTSSLSTRSLPDTLLPAIKRMARDATEFLELDHDPTSEGAARAFCHELRLPPSAVVEKMVVRDGRVLRLRDGHLVVPGAAYGLPRHAAASAGPDADDDAAVAPEASGLWPDWISPRVNNLFLLGLDLKGRLGSWLEKGAQQ